VQKIYHDLEATIPKLKLSITLQSTNRWEGSIPWSPFVESAVRTEGNEVMALQLEGIGKVESERLGELLVPLIVDATK
jgi:hypothetical protein